MLSEIIGTLSFFQPSYDDDFIDRLNYYYTSTFVIVSAIVISFKMLGGRPLECWVPAEYKGSWEDYSEVYCWAQNTYFVPFDSQIPRELAERQFQEVSYYQWCPFFLLASAFAFYFPCILWRVLNDKSGIRLNDIVQVVKDRSNLHPETREKNIQGLTAHLLSLFRRQFKRGTRKSGMHKYVRCFNWRYFEVYMTFVYLFVKFLFCANAFLQLFLMNKFLQTDDYGIYGYGVLRDILSGRSWKNSGNFPRVTMCDMEIRVLGNVQRHTVQCVLVINIFIEKIFIMLWMWYTVLAILSFASLLYWFGSSLLPNRRLRFVVRNLEIADIDFDTELYGEEVERFVSNWVKMDGVFVLRMITVHNGLMFAMELVHSMWRKFLQEEGQQKLQANSKFVNGRGNLSINQVDGHKNLPVNSNAETNSDDERKDAENDDHNGESASLVSPANRPPLERRTSVFVPLLLPHADKKDLPQPKSPRRLFKRSSSTCR